jgi:hypothetical protein
MEKIFNAEDELEFKIIGRSFPQVVGSDTRELISENMKYVEEEKFNTIPKNGYSVKISKSVKLTDSISSFMTNYSPIVSEKLVDLLGKFRVPRFLLIPIRMYRVKELVTEKKYYVMHFYGNDIPSIDFGKSTFDYLCGGAFLDKSLLKFDSHEDYMRKLNNDEVKMAIIQKVVMKPTLKHDLFFLDIYKGSARFVTQTLKEGMEKENISGFHFEEVGYVEA